MVMLRLSPMMSRAATAPFADLDAIVGNGGLVVLAPHPTTKASGAAPCYGRRSRRCTPTLR